MKDLEDLKKLWVEKTEENGKNKANETATMASNISTLQHFHNTTPKQLISANTTILTNILFFVTNFFPLSLGK